MRKHDFIDFVYKNTNHEGAEYERKCFLWYTLLSESEICQKNGNKQEPNDKIM